MADRNNMPGSRKKKRGKTDDHLHRRRQHHDGAGSADGDDLAVRNVTGKELSEVEEQSARLTALVEMLDEKGVISMREYQRRVAMRLHEISKAGAIEELDEEL